MDFSSKMPRRCQPDLIVKDGVLKIGLIGVSVSES